MPALAAKLAQAALTCLRGQSHLQTLSSAKTWMARTSPAMTRRSRYGRLILLIPADLAAGRGIDVARHAEIVLAHHRLAADKPAPPAILALGDVARRARFLGG